MTTLISQEDAYELFEICKKTKIPLLQYKNYNNGKTSKHRHWNTPLVSGTKYSFVFYT